MKAKYIVLSVLIIIIFLFGYTFVFPQKEIHYHAGFLVYVNGVQQNFSDTKFMKIEPCVAKGAKPQENEQLEKGHLHDNVGDVAHVEREGAVWKDLFTNIHFTFPKAATIVGYINGEKIPDILNYPVKAYDSVIIIVGNDTGVDLTKSVTREHIIEEEKKIESCGV